MRLRPEPQVSGPYAVFATVVSMIGPSQRNRDAQSDTEAGFAGMDSHNIAAMICRKSVTRRLREARLESLLHLYGGSIHDAESIEECGHCQRGTCSDIAPVLQ
jgi:hypothetical protein